MNKVVLIAGSETLLGRKLMESTLEAGDSVIAPVMTDQESLKGSKRESLFITPWNRSSWVSAKTVLREGLRQFSTIDQAYFISPEYRYPKSFEQIKSEDIDKNVNLYLNGTTYLLLEVLDYFRKQDKGSLSFIETPKSQEFTHPLDGLVSGGFHNFAEGVLLSENSSIFRVGFCTDSAEMVDYATFIRDIVNNADAKAQGEWLKFSDKKALFQSLPIIKRK